MKLKNTIMIFWDIYEIRCDCEQLHGVKLRGRLRKYAIENGIVCLAENAEDDDNVVRLAVIADSDVKLISDYIKRILPSSSISESLKNVANPTISKLKVNDISRY